MPRTKEHGRDPVRLEALRDLRSRHPNGLTADELDRLTAFIGFYLASKANH